MSKSVLDPLYRHFLILGLSISVPGVLKLRYGDYGIPRGRRVRRRGARVGAGAAAADAAERRARRHPARGRGLVAAPEPGRAAGRLVARALRTAGPPR